MTNGYMGMSGNCDGEDVFGLRGFSEPIGGCAEDCAPGSASALLNQLFIARPIGEVKS